jgi:LPXTG-motif cell wall-anchored protein
VSGSSNVGGVVGNNTGDVENSYYVGANFAFGGSTATNGTDSEGQGIPFVKIKDKVDINEATIVTEQTDVNDTSNWNNDLGVNFAVAYPAIYTSTNASIASVDAKTISGVATGNVNITGIMTITQNELTDTGFDGATKNITVPIAMPLFVMANPTLTLSVAPTSATVGTEVTLAATLSNANNPKGTVTFKNGTTEIGNTTTILGDVATINYTPLASETLNITAEYSGDESNNSATSAELNYEVGKGTQTGFVFSEEVPTAKVYGDPTFNLEVIGGTGTGAVTYSSSDASILTVNNTGDVTISGAGKATITATKAGDSNYNEISVTTNEITVNPINLIATITPNNKLYDGDTDATINGEITYNKIINSDEVAITGGTLKFTNKDVGTGKTVTASGYILEGAKKSNYTLIQTSCTTADINKATLNVSINPVILNCGQDIPVPTVNVSGFKNGESESLADFEKPTASPTYGSTTSPANVTLDVIYNSGNPTNNYEFSYENTTTITISSVDITNSDYALAGENNSEWYKGDVTITPINGYTQISIDNGTTWSEAVVISTETAAGAIAFKLKKADGTQTTQKTEDYKLDKTAPTSPTFKYTKTDDNILSKTGNFLTFGIFWKEEINVEVSSIDEVSSVATIKYNKEGVDKTVTTTTGKIQFTVPLEFSGEISTAATDNAGNTSATVTSEGIILENEKPIITVETDLTNWKSTDFDVDATATDSKAGISKIIYKINSEAVVTAFELSSETELVKAKDIQIPIATQGENIVIIEVTDNAGNTQTETVIAKLDKIAPTITATGDTTNYKQSDSVIVNTTQGASNVSKFEVSKDGGSFEKVIANSYTVTANGTYAFRVINGSGVVATTNLIYANIDITKPVVNIDSNGYAAGIWSNNNITLNVSNNSSNLGTTKFEVSTDGTNFTPIINGELIINTDSIKTYSFKATSESGVECDVLTYIAKLDKTAPTSPIIKYTKKDDNKLSKIGNFLTFGIFWKEDINVEISSIDALSSVASIKYNKDGVDKTVTTTTGKIQFTVPLEFSGEISIAATDNAGNTSATVTSEGIILEKEKPIITVETDLTNWKSTNFDVDIAVMDSKAGISKITYKINSDAVVIAFELSSETELVKAKDIQIPIATEGENIVIIEVTDNAGNTQTEIVVAKLDKIAPVIYEHATIVSGSNKDAVSVNIKRSTLDKEIGIIDTLIITIDSIKGLTDKIDPSAQSDARTVTINMPEPKDGTPKANQQAVEIPALAVQAMAEKNAILEIKIGDVKIEIDSAELKEINKSGIDLYFNVVPINDSLEKSKLSDRTKSNVDVIKIANELGNGGVVVQGIPYAVETNYSGFNTKLVIPFTGMTIPTENKNAFLDSLKVYIEHTDGTKEVKNGAIVYDNGNPIGIEITIDKFSSFQILSIDQSKSSSSIPKTGSRFDMMTLLILGGVLMLIGFGLLMIRRKRMKKIS